MHNIKDIRLNFDDFIKTISKRNHRIDKELLLSLDRKNRDLIQKKKILNKKKKLFQKAKINLYLKSLKKCLTKLIKFHLNKQKLKII